MNIDPETGIRYGVISVHALGQAWYDSCVPWYGEPACPLCGSTNIKQNGENHCGDCGATFSEEIGSSELALSCYYEDGQYEAEESFDFGAVFVTKSPYYTYCKLCSPCVPNAGDLDSPAENGEGYKTYCFGHEWFDSGVAPYRVYSVATDELVVTQAVSGANNHRS